MAKYLYRVELVEYNADGKLTKPDVYGEGDYIEFDTSAVGNAWPASFISVRLRCESKTIPTSSFGA